MTKFGLCLENVYENKKTLSFVLLRNCNEFF